jgi:hypothetical protein
MKKLRGLLAGVTMVSALTVLAPSPAQASCGPVVIEACRLVCKVGTSHPATAPTVYRLCSIT